METDLKDTKLFRRVVKHLIDDDDVWLRYLTSKNKTPIECMAPDHGELIGAAAGKNLFNFFVISSNNKGC